MTVKLDGSNRNPDGSDHRRLLEKLNAFLALEKQLRTAGSEGEIARSACSDCQMLLNIDSAIFFRAPYLRAIAASNVIDIDNTSGEILDCRALLQRHGPVDERGQAAFESGGTHYLAARIGDFGQLLFLRSAPFSDHEQQVQRELADAVLQAFLARRGARRRPWHLHLSRRKLWVAALLIGVGLLPIRQSVLAPATLAAIEPRIVSARTEGVIRSIAVPPNAPVETDQLLFTLESAEVEAEIDKVQQEIALYRERLRMTRQYNFREAAAGHRLAQAETDLAIRHLELEYQGDILRKTRVRAPDTGVAIFTDPSEWIGRRVRAGEKVMEIVRPDARQIRIDLPTADAIELPQNAETVFYAEANPLAPIRGRISYQSLMTTDGENRPASYRLIAAIGEDRPGIRINTQGHARIYGARVPLVYYLLRRPLASARRWLGF
ncbi:efflux RND transporter periplasmic adaptor subunit [Microbulbifer litoralis]|uniref:efflux RND transporter periplasmic adaptor subunit n=1 Tax=Microbulbifer litoralis TaxID=2933965 RepID=UPI002027C00E|nr:HlyD family efflux transporter periplasmic adaptor subunit [Microbulbifer sp. GX H0434]